MKCADPKLCFISSGKKQLRHWSLASAVFRRAAQMVFDCGQCIFCRKKRAYELACRCVLHSSLYKQNCFLTLTYDENQEGYHNNFEYSDIQKFKKRLRQHCRRKYGSRIEIFNVHEYGKRGKKHWHLVVFNYSPHQEPDQEMQPDCRIHSRSNGISLYVSETLSRMWPYGFSTVGDVSAASAMYAAQYVEKDLKNGNRQNSKKSHSKHSGIGRPYFMAHYRQLLSLGYVPINGRKLPLPRYFQKLAHRHFCHFYDPAAFVDLPWRKALYRPFKKESPNKEIADLWIQFDQQKQEKVSEYEQQWQELLQQHIDTKEAPDFVQSASNAIYDLKNKISIERF